MINAVLIREGNYVQRPQPRRGNAGRGKGAIAETVQRVLDGGKDLRDAGFRQIVARHVEGIGIRTGNDGDILRVGVLDAGDGDVIFLQV